MQYRVAEEVRKIAQPIVADHHRHLVNTRIEFLFSYNTPTSGGQEVWAKSRKISGLSAFLASEDEYPKAWVEKEANEAGASGEDAPGYPGPFFVMVVASPIWHDLTLEQKHALVDHELCHMEKDEDSGKLATRGHFIEEFPEVLKRHGLWSRESQVFHATSEKAAQLTLDDADTDDDAGAAA